MFKKIKMDEKTMRIILEYISIFLHSKLKKAVFNYGPVTKKIPKGLKHLQFTKEGTAPYKIVFSD